MKVLIVDDEPLACERLAVSTDADDVTRAPADAAALEQHHVGLVTEHLTDVGAQPPRCCPRVELGLDDHAAVHQMQ